MFGTVDLTGMWKYSCVSRRCWQTRLLGRITKNTAIQTGMPRFSSVFSFQTHKNPTYMLVAVFLRFNFYNPSIKHLLPCVHFNIRMACFGFNIFAATKEPRWPLVYHHSWPSPTMSWRFWSSTLSCFSSSCPCQSPFGGTTPNHFMKPGYICPSFCCFLLGFHGYLFISVTSASYFCCMCYMSTVLIISENRYLFSFHILLSSLYNNFLLLPAY